MGDPGAWLVIASPFGPIHAAATERGVVGLEMRTTADAFVGEIARRLRAEPVSRQTAPRAVGIVLDAVERQVDQYVAAGRSAFDVALDLRTRSDWDRRVLEGVRRIGHGEVTSYGRLAGLIGRPGAARAVGGSVGRNPIGLLVPCHRIIAGDGSIGGYGGSWYGSREEMLALKRTLLAHEGVELPATVLVG
jgi:methylated-DNA-[protein]-cysteine S-methyltransferase